MTVQVWIAILVGLAATVDDLARRQIANWIPAAALAGGFGWQIGRAAGGRAAGAGGSGGGVRGVPDFLSVGRNGRRRREVDGGIRSAAGSPGGCSEAALWTAVVGGVLALCALAGKAVMRRIRGPERGRKNQNGEEKESIPYAPAITLGVWLSLVPKG